MNLTNPPSLVARLKTAGKRWAGARAVVAVEFALTLPIWIALLLGCADTAYMMIISERVDRIAYSVTDILTQSQKLAASDLNNTMLAAAELMKPFVFGANGVVIVSSVYKATGSAAKIYWQYTGGGTLARGSKVGSTGGVPSLPGAITLNDNENVIVTEVYYAFTPMFINAGILSAHDFYRAAVYKPRLSSLTATPS